VTHKTAKSNFINSGAVDIIRAGSGLQLMKLIFAVLYVSRATGLTRCYKMTAFFKLNIVRNINRSESNIL